MVVEGPRSAGGVQERSAQTIFLSGVTSMACTGAFEMSTLPDHSLNQLLMIVFPFARRVAVWRSESTYPGASAEVNSQTVAPFRSTSRTYFRELPAIRTLPF